MKPRDEIRQQRALVAQRTMEYDRAQNAVLEAEHRRREARQRLDEAHWHLTILKQREQKATG